MVKEIPLVQVLEEIGQSLARDEQLATHLAMPKSHCERGTNLSKCHASYCTDTLASKEESNKEEEVINSLLPLARLHFILLNVGGFS